MPAGARISAGKSGKVAMSLPSEGGGVGELRAGELHAVAGVAGEPDGDGLDFFGGGRPFRVVMVISPSRAAIGWESGWTSLDIRDPASRERERPEDFAFSALRRSRSARRAIL